MLGIAMAGASIVSGILGSKSSKRQAKAQKAQLNWEKKMYNEGKAYFAGHGEEANIAFNAAIDTMSFGAGGSASASLAQAYDAKAYDMKAYMADSYKVELDGFIDSFKNAEDINDISMDTFSRRYGQVMDNVKQNILNVSQERLSASGREQLALDAKTLSKNFDQEMAVKGMGRSGITVESKARMAMEVNKQARAIDVNSYDQANQLQSMGVQTLNSMTAQEQQIAGRRENMFQNKAQGMLQAGMQNANLKTQTSHLNANNRTLASRTNAQNKTNVSMSNASNRTNVSMANAQNKTNVSMTNANIASNKQLAIANMYQNKWSMQQGAANNFYGGNPGSGVSTAYNGQAEQAGQEAAGWGKTMGWAAEKAYDAWKTPGG